MMLSFPLLSLIGSEHDNPAHNLKTHLCTCRHTHTHTFLRTGNKGRPSPSHPQEQQGVHTPFKREPHSTQGEGVAADAPEPQPPALKGERATARITAKSEAHATVENQSGTQPACSGPPFDCLGGEGLQGRNFYAFPTLEQLVRVFFVCC